MRIAYSQENDQIDVIGIQRATGVQIETIKNNGLLASKPCLLIEQIERWQIEDTSPEPDPAEIIDPSQVS